MEFLVRLVDKTNTSVHCLNPVHEDVKTVYDDPTFLAPCPFCSSTLYLFRKNNAVTKKGHFITYKPDDWQWGRMELRHYGIVRIDCTDQEARALCASGGMDHEVFLNEHRRIWKNINSAPNEAARRQAEAEFRALENSYNILIKARLKKLDFDAFLTSAQKSSWENQDEESEIVVLNDVDKGYIE